VKCTKPYISTIEYVIDSEASTYWFELWVNAAKNYLLNKLDEDA